MRFVKKYEDRCIACLVGGAAGDALGYAVEFMTNKQIQEQYGPGGIRRFELRDGVARVSDDTQMTLFTAEGMILSKGDCIQDYIDAIRREYLWWFITQTENWPVGDSITQASFLMREPELYASRAPGTTCMGALSTGGRGSVAEPVNNSKGCGGVMRVAPIGLFLTTDVFSAEKIVQLGAEAAALTHGNPLGWLPAAALVHMIRVLSQEDADVFEAVKDAVAMLRIVYPNVKERETLEALLAKAITLYRNGTGPARAIPQLGEGWVGDEALAIAVYCALRYEAHFDRAIIAAVNHDGDSDSTGAIVGNILGARLGRTGIPTRFCNKLELKGLMETLGTALAADPPTPQ